MSDKPAILVTQPHLAPIAAMLEADFTVWRLWEGPPLEASQTIGALVVAGEFEVDRALASRLPNLGLIACFTAGYDGVDLAWAAEHGLHLVVANICAGEGLDTDSHGIAQLTHIRAYRERFSRPGPPRVVAGRVIVPLDRADSATRAKYRDYEASRHERTLTPQGERRILIAPDVVGTSEEIVEALRADPVLAEINELQVELPYAFSHAEYEQILSDVVESIAPLLGWSPSLVTS